MTWREVRVVFRKELLDSLRDRRTLISMILVPVLVIPALTVGMTSITRRAAANAMKRSSIVMLVGGADSPRAVQAMKDAAFVEWMPGRADYAKLIASKEIDAAAELPVGFDAAVEAGDLLTVKIFMYEGEVRSHVAASRVQEALLAYRDRTVRRRMAERDLPESLLSPFAVVTETVGSSVFAGLIPYIIILLCLTGAAHPAMDLTAGEKERGTMETILSSAAGRSSLVLGKFLVVLITAFGSALLSVLSLAVSVYAGGSLADDAPIGSTPSPAAEMNVDASAAVAVIGMVLPVAVFLSAALLAISLFARSYKEAQSYVSPLMLAVMISSVTAVMPGVELSPTLAAIPILNTSLVSKEILTGSYNWPYILAIFGSSCVYAAAALAIAVHLFNREEVLFRS